VKSSEQPGCTAEPCPEKDRLYRRFETAESTWTEVSVAPIVAGIVMNRTPVTTSREALQARNATANELYEHRQGCKVCKRLEIEKKYTQSHHHELSGELGDISTSKSGTNEDRRGTPIWEMHEAHHQ
jgi:hypothetical protein